MVSWYKSLATALSLSKFFPKIQKITKSTSKEILNSASDLIAQASPSTTTENPIHTYFEIKIININKSILINLMIDFRILMSNKYILLFTFEQIYAAYLPVVR